ncbi:hypothetical protein H5410_028853 [Solanum commersonii]|uniref:Uncharacterized protein n=1 Tax=Solanum commersonii TaxID=4109 RepID=A0A9J5Z3B5_SOLCO|nr:hypothetical protein H5410_028853 [Solanum commersonii]
MKIIPTPFSSSPQSININLSDLGHILSPLINRGGRKWCWWCTPETTASQWSERERGDTGQWRGEWGGVMVRERVYAISPAKMAMTTAMTSPIDFGREQ